MVFCGVIYFSILLWWVLRLCFPSFQKRLWTFQDKSPWAPVREPVPSRSLDGDWLMQPDPTVDCQTALPSQDTELHFHQQHLNVPMALCPWQRLTNAFPRWPIWQVWNGMTASSCIPVTPGTLDRTSFLVFTGHLGFFFIRVPSYVLPHFSTWHLSFSYW